MKLKIIDTARHRNGICGAPFDVMVFNDGESIKLAVLFEAEHHCAIFDLIKLAQGDIAFGSNSWRGDQYEPHLRKVIVERERAIDAESLGGKEA